MLQINNIPEYTMTLPIFNTINFALNLSEYKVSNVDPIEADHFKGDLSGLLLTLSVDPKLLPIHINLNGYKSSTEYDGKQTSFKILTNVDRLTSLDL